MKNENYENSAGKMHVEDLENGTTPDTVDPTTVMDPIKEEAEDPAIPEVSEGGTDAGDLLGDSDAGAPAKRTRAPFVIAGLLGALLVGGVAWALCTQPIGMGTDLGSGSMGSSPASLSAGSGEVAGVSDEAGQEDTADAQGGADEELGQGETEANGPDGGAAADEGPSGASNTAKADSSPSKQKPSSGSGSSSKPSLGGGSSSAGSSTSKPAEKPSKPAHQHSWQAVYRTEPVYEQQWVSNWVDVFSHRQERFICTTCGAVYNSLSAMNGHLDSTIDWDNMTGHAGYIDDSYDVYKKVDKGSYQSVQTGTKQVLSHYACSCGATK